MMLTLDYLRVQLLALFFEWLQPICQLLGSTAPGLESGWLHSLFLQAGCYCQALAVYG